MNFPEQIGRELVGLHFRIGHQVSLSRRAPGERVSRATSEPCHRRGGDGLLGEAALKLILVRWHGRPYRGLKRLSTLHCCCMYSTPRLSLKSTHKTARMSCSCRVQSFCQTCRDCTQHRFSAPRGYYYDTNRRPWMRETDHDRGCSLR